MADRATQQFVSPIDHEQQLREIQQLAGEAHHGFFGPESITWRVNRESAIFLGAGRAALLQLAHPWVAASLLHHSNLLNDAIGRFHSTFRVIYTMLFGTRTQAIAASRQVYRLHTGIRGELPDDVGGRPAGEHYEANEIEALCWVFATLVDSAILAYNFALPRLSRSEHGQFYAESKRMAALFGIPASALPMDWDAFGRYMAEMLESPHLAVDENARLLARSVMSGAGTWVHPPRWYHSLTASWMTPRLRRSFDLSFSVQDEKRVQRAAGQLPWLYSRLPNPIRLVGPYHEAQARLRGQTPGPLIRLNNRFWMGLPKLLYANLQS